MPVSTESTSASERGHHARPLVSIAIPTYKGAAYLPAAIESVLGQSFRDFELLIVDDHSPDETAAIVEGYTDPRIRYLRNETNLGPEGNWNRCLAEAKGLYFKLLPHDDLLLPGCLEKQACVLRDDDAETIALTFCARRIQSGDKWVATRGFPFRSAGSMGGELAVRRCVQMGTNLIGEPGAVMFRKSLAEKVGPFDGTQGYVIDLNYWFRLLRHGSAYYDPKPLAVFRVSGGSWSVRIGNRQSTEFNRFVQDFAAGSDFAGLNRLDISCGRFMAAVNNMLRLIFYKFAAK